MFDAIIPQNLLKDNRIGVIEWIFVIEIWGACNPTNSSVESQMEVDPNEGRA